MAIKKAQQEVRQSGNLPVPLAIRNAPTQLMKDLNYGKNYQYAHDFDKNFVDMEYMPEEIKGNTFYQPGQNSPEERIKKVLKENWGKKYGY